MDAPGARLELLLVRLHEATSELAKSANLCASRMALRAKLSDAIQGARTVERIAETLRTVAAADADSGEASLVPDLARDIECQRQGADG
ncbi:MAG TPA: hypothetical protein VFB29_04940 [Pseudolabrys sp.]|nr:hypothetical protein [Pseudolabrys sp.]